MIRILLADDHDVVRRGLRGLLEDRPDWRVCAEAATGPEAVRLAAALQPDIAVLDLAMPGLDGLEATRRIRRAAPATAALIFTLHESADLARAARAAGARGYVLKADAARQLLAAVEALAAGAAFVAPRARAATPGEEARPSLAPAGALTAREREVLALLETPLAGKEIALELSISPRTVKKHTIAIYRKLGAAGRRRAVARAKELGLLGAPRD